MTTGRYTLLFFIVASFCVYLAVGQTSTGLVIDGARIASTFFIRDEYYQPDDCLVKVFQFTKGFRKVARFDLALANLGSEDFFTTRAHPPSLCGGLNRFNNLLSIDVLDAGGNPTLYISQPKGICLEDTELASGTPSGTPATKANYTCVASTNGISVGWQTVVPAENDMMTVDLTPIYTDGNPGQFYHLVVKIRMSLLGNYTDVSYTHGFYMPYDNNCYPTPAYTVTTTASQWVDPATNGHTEVTGWTAQTETPPSVQVKSASMGAFSFIDTPFCLSADPVQVFIRDNGMMAFDVGSIPTSGPGVGNLYDNVIPSPAGSPFYVGRTVFPFWDSYGYINSTVTKIYAEGNSNNLWVTWTGINRLFATEYFPVEAQVKFSRNGDAVFSYNALPNGVAAYKDGANATVGICAGAVKDPGNGNFTGNNFFFQSNVDNNCVLYSVNQPNKLSTANSIVFTKNPSTTRTVPAEPVANVTGPLSGQINSTYEYSAEFSQTFGTASSVRYQWIWGDGSIPSYGVKVNHTWISVGVYSIRMRVFDGIQFSSEANYTIYMGPIILNNETATGGDGSDNTGGYIAIAVVLPILFVIVLVILLAIFLFVFFRRHVLPSGGAWWEDDPIYLNLEEQQ